NRILEAYGEQPLDAGQLADDQLEAAARLGDRIVSALPLVEDFVSRDARVLLEGQLGAMRDLDWGIYPFVTSSNPLAGGASIGAGIPPRLITRVIGVVKAYSTAVGEGPFPTELHGPEADALRERAGEYGATTGRPRRVGWFDAVAARYAHRLNLFTDIAVTKLDVLDVHERIPIAVRYRLNGMETDDMPPTGLLEQAQPVYETAPGWCVATTSARSREALPRRALGYLDRVSTLVGAPISMIGVGPERKATILT